MHQQRTSSWMKTTAMLLGLVAGGSLAGTSFAQVKPGDFITPENSSRVQDLVGPGVYYKVQHGMTMKIVPTERVDWPPPYKDATEKYSSQVRLSQDHRSVVGYVAGQPFPLIDANDPEVAEKIVWNNVFRPITTDDYDLRYYDCDSSYEKNGPQTMQIDYFQIGHYAGYDLVGRTEVEPTPIDPDYKTTGRYWVFGLYPLLAPQEIRGSGFIRWRYADPKRGDDTWSLDAGSRRVRRVNESILSSSTTAGGNNPSGGTAAHSWDPDHYSGFNPKTEQYTYKFLGEKNMLATIHAVHSPEERCPTDGGTSACPEAWEMRHMYIVQALPDRSRINALDSRTVIYMDSEMWFEPYIDTYDRSGNLFRSHIYWLATRDRPVPDAKVAIYPFKRSFVVGAVSTDVQSGLATMCYLPGRETPERECWYINMGAVDKSFFTTDAMVRAANF
ncbi:MAG TPA: DUF1329 domain-containing protein [Candidatus Binataceae bacterium]|nr:DUF1329 domain-containing protein [Candidatus Binataceae bacterium]